MTKLILTDSEWMGLIDSTREADAGGALPRCCGNISALRDDFIFIARNGGELDALIEPQIKMHLGWITSDHEVTPVLKKVIDQLGWSIEEFMSSDHERQDMEI